MNIQLIAHAESSAWNEMIKTSEQGTLFHSSEWMIASPLAGSLIGVFEHNELVGGFAIAQEPSIKKPAAKMPPFTPYMGLATTNFSAKLVAQSSREKELSTTLAEYLKENFVTVDVRFAPNVGDMQPFIWGGFNVGVRYTYIVELESLKVAWERMDAKRRNDIRKAEKEGLKVIADVSIEQLLEVIEYTLRRQDVWSPQHRQTIQKYDRSLKTMRQRRIFGVVNGSGELVAGIYIAWDNKRSYYLLGGYRDESARGGPALALWEAMKFTREELLLKEFDLEGSMVPGIEKFFRQFGGRLTPVFTASWIDPKWRCRLQLNERLKRLKTRLANGKV